MLPGAKSASAERVLVIMILPQTSHTLLHRLCSPGEEAAWRQFVEIYTPLLHRHALARGVPAQDVCDVVQETMRRLFLALPRFDYRPERARFRTWLYRVAENQVNQFFRTRRRRPQGDGRTTLMNVADEVLAAERAEEIAARWEREYQRRLFEWAATQVKPEFTPRIWTAFWRTTVGGEPTETVARTLGMSHAAIYMARNRCVRRIRERIASAGAHDFESLEDTALCLAES